MKTLFFCILIPVISYIKTSGQTPSSCTPTAYLSANYSNDAKNLAVTRMYAIHSADTSFINIPVTDEDSVLNDMAAIFNLDTTLQADSVFKRYCIHSEIEKSLTVFIDLSTIWGQRWRAGDSLTGYGALDSFMGFYGFAYGALINLGGSGYGTIGTKQIINMRAFSDSLMLFPGIYVQPNYLPGGPPTEITYSGDSARIYAFSINWGDCPSGCTDSKTWTYKVDDLCNVTLLSVNLYIGDGYPFPKPSDCFYDVKVPEINNSLSINTYPNPANNLLHISITGNDNLCQYTFTNVYGQVASKGVVMHNAIINLSNIPAGVYVLQVINNTGKLYYQKIVKE